MNNSTARHPDVLDFISTGILALSVLIYMAVVALVLYLRLHTVLVYRLGLYQVISAMLFGIADGVYCWINSVTAYDLVYAFVLALALLKVMLNMWVVVHLFALAVLHKNMRKWEIIYLLSSISVALLFCCLLIIGVYAKDVDLFNDIVFMAALASVLLVSSIVLAIAMIVTLCWRACRNKKLISQLDQQHKNALYEMMPLMTYPILFLVISVPAIAYVNYEIHGGYPRWLEDVYEISGSSLSFLNPFLFTIHVCVVLCVRRKKPKLVTSYTEGCGLHDMHVMQSIIHMGV